MKKRMLMIVLITGLSGIAGAALADPVYGIWRTAKDDNGNFGHIDIAACGANICGTLVRPFDSSGAGVQSENLGKKIIWDMTAQGDGA